MNKTTFDIAFDYEGVHYTGWATPADHVQADGQPASYHVVLNDTFFGNVSYHDDHWMVDQQRPAGLVAEVGRIIQSRWK
jgi:hypothetical protein